MTKTNHNDMHIDNIWIKDTLEPVETTYVIDDDSYTIFTRYKVMIYDFDRSYSVNLGKNKLIKDKSSRSYQCNEFYPSKDLFKIVCYLLDPYIYNIMKKEIRL